MPQEMQYLKNRVKNLFEENMKLKSQIEGPLSCLIVGGEVE